MWYFGKWFLHSVKGCYQYYFKAEGSGAVNKMSKRTKDNLEYVKKELVILVAYVLAVSEVDFTVTEGYRSQTR